MSTDADFTLDKVWTRGVSELVTEEHVPSMPGAIYEVAPGLVGEMVWPTLAVQEKVQELNAQLQDIFREDATSEQFQAMTKAAREGEGLDPDDSPIKDGVTVQEFDQTTTMVNVNVACEVLEFEQQVEPHDLDPYMASVVRQHFLALGPATSGQSNT